MKFCPLCEKDFDDSLQECPDCGEILLNGNFSNQSIIFSHENEALILKIFNYLHERNASFVQYYYEAQKNCYFLIAPEEEEAIFQAEILFYAKDSERSELSQTERSEILQQLSFLEETLNPDEGAKTFIHAKDRYDDMMSSASSLLVVGIAGFVLIALIYAKIIPIEMNLLFYLLSSVMFAAFLIAGITSLLKAQKIRNTISSEDSLAEEIKTYLLSLKDTLQPEASDLSEEEAYFARTDELKKRVNEKFQNANELMIDSIIEDVYNTLYPTETIS